MAARRYNKGKLRYELIPPSMLKELAKVFTIGADKYTIYDDEGVIKDDGANNWKKGMPWTDVLASVQRHIEKFKQGEDYDDEYPIELLEKYGKTYHLANAVWGLGVLLEYYSIYPQGDDRRHSYLSHFKIGLDIDEVLCDWVKSWTEKFGYNIPNHWNFSYSNSEHFKSMSTEELKDFFLNIPVKMKSEDLPFEPHCYITNRNIPVEITQEWLQKNGFPTVKVYSVGNESKVDAALKSGLDIFVDDAYHNFVELNNAGVCTYLLTAPHNLKYSVGHKRINSLKELAERLK
jgi:uncharacterized HAD superfamily protein